MITVFREPNLEVLFILVPIVLLAVAAAIKLLFWAINNGQYDDLNTEGNRILFDDEPIAPATPTIKKDVNNDNTKPDNHD